MNEMATSVTNPEAGPAREFSPWLTLAITPFEWLCSSGIDRTLAAIRCLSALGRIDFAGVYGLLNDLLL